MVRDLSDELRSSATDRRGPMRPVGMGMKQDGRSIPVYWDSIALSRCRNQRRPGPGRGCTRRRRGIARHRGHCAGASRQTGAHHPRQECTPDCRRHQERTPRSCLPDRADAGRGRGNRCRQGAGSRQRGWRGADRAHQLAEHRGRATATRAGPHRQRHHRKSIHAGRAVSRFRCVSGRRYAAGTGGLPERDAHQRSLRRHRQLGLDPDRRDQVGDCRDQQSGVRAQRAGWRRQRADEEWLQLPGRRNQHDGRLVRTHPEFGAVRQADRQFFRLWCAGRRARKRLPQFFGVGDPPLLRRCRLPDRQQ